MEQLILKLRTRLDDIGDIEQEFDDETLEGHINNSLDKHDLSLPLERKSDEQLIIIEALIAIVTALKLWADGESYSYKNDAIQMTRGLMSKHYQDTIRLLRTERDDILEGNGGVY
ncbi:hypothetical protein [Microcystis phage MaeS]|nr:hypothetical protein [Microcystis phage MaeS]